jgi:UBX domain-containing protein 1
MDDAPNQDELISRFCNLTGVAPSEVSLPYILSLYSFSTNFNLVS